MTVSAWSTAERVLSDHLAEVLDETKGKPLKGARRTVTCSANGIGVDRMTRRVARDDAERNFF
jgi:hypothetical protein